MCVCVCAQALNQLSKLCGEARRRELAQQQEQRVVELKEAWAARRFAEVHRVSLLLAGARHGPKIRM